MENKHQKVKKKKNKYTYTNLQAARQILQKGMRLKSQKKNRISESFTVTYVANAQK